MKKLLILTALVYGLFTACTGTSSNESETPATAEQEQMSADSTIISNVDSTQASADKAAKDSADAAHGHSH